MKKLLAMLLVISVLMSALAGCVVLPDDDSKPIGTKPQGTTASQDEEGGDSADPTDAAPTEGEKKDVTIAETVVYDENNIKLTVKGMEESWSGIDLKVLLENNTDENVTFSIDEFVINGICISGLGYVEAAAGKKSNDTISLYDEDLETAGIKTIATIEGKEGRIINSDSYDKLYDVPFKVVTSAGEDYAQTVDNSGDVLFEAEGITVIAKSIQENLLGQSVCLFVENETGKDIVVNAEDVSVNGFTVTTLMYENVYADTVRFCDLLLLSSELEENEIETVENVTFKLEVIDPETYEHIADSEELEVIVK